MGASSSAPSASATSITRTFSRLLKAPLPESAASVDLFADLFPADLSVDARTLFSVVSPSHVAELSALFPRSLARLILYAADVLDSAAAAPEEACVCRALNAARVLARLLPPLIGTNASFVTALFWNNVEPRAADEAATSAHATSEWAPSTQTDAAPPLGLRVLHATLRLLFSKSFSVSDVAHEIFVKCAAADEAGAAAAGDDIAVAPLPTVSNAVWPMLLWAPGSGARDVTPPPPPAAVVAARIDLLRLLLALLSSPLFRDASKPQRQCRFADALTGGSAPFVPCLFFSLINTAFPIEGSFPDPLAVGGDTGALASLSAHTLLAALDYRPPDAVASDSSVVFSDPNVFRRLLSGLRAGPDIESLYDGVSRSLATIASAADADVLGGGGGALSTIVNAVGLGGARVEPAGVTPAPLLMLWKLLDESPAFCARVLAVDGLAASRLGAPLAVYFNAIRRSDARAPAAQLALLLLARLSGERRFAVSLNATLRISVPTDFPPLGYDARVADAFVLACLRAVDDASPKLAPLAPLALAALCNIAPFAKGLAEPVCTRILDLLESLTSPQKIASNAAPLATALLSALRALVEHQSEGNSVLLHVILLRANVFASIAALDVPSITNARVSTGATSVEPTEAWWAPLKSSFDSDLVPIQTLIKYLAPRIAAALSDSGDAGLDRDAIIGFLRRETLVGVLPLPLSVSYVL
jgi:hypothetical protein